MISLMITLISVNLLKSSDVTCDAPYTLSSYPCNKAFDGCYGIGKTAEWIVHRGSTASLTLTFTEPVTVTKVVMWFRCALIDQSDSFDIEYSEGTSEEVIILSKIIFNQYFYRLSIWNNPCTLIGQSIHR